MKNRFLKYFVSVLISAVGFLSTTLAQNTFLPTVPDGLFETISEQGAYVDDLSQVDLNNLPIGLKRTISNMEVTVAISNVSFAHAYSEFGVYAKAVLPQGDGGKQMVLFFGAEGIKGNNQGGISGELKLSLLKDIDIHFNSGNTTISLKGGLNHSTGEAESGTFITVDCNGFKAMGLDADVVFPESLIRPVDKNGSIVLGQVKGHFQTEIENWSDLLVQLEIPRFQIVGLDGYLFSLQNVMLDFSDLRNYDMKFPGNYSAKYMIPGAHQLWRGVYAKEISITLPKAFDSINNEPTAFSAQNMIIDDNGISGIFSAENILTLKNGSAGGWSFSVNHFGLKLEANQLIEAKFNGELELPFSGKSTTLGYKGLIHPNNEYLMQVSAADSIDFPIFAAKASILSNSYVALHMIDGRFFPEAVLHGNMSIAATKAGASTQDNPVAIPSIEFRSLKLSSLSPYISVEYLGYSGKPLLGNLPISLNSIAIHCEHEKARLESDISVNLGDQLFAARTKLAFLAQIEEKEGRKKWAFDCVQLDEIALKASIAETLEMEGQLAWMRNDAIYGDGFSGDINIKIKPLKSISINTRGTFGQKDDFKYWFAEGSCTFSPAMPVGGVLSLSGLGAGVTYKMKSDGAPVKGNDGFARTRYIPNAELGLGLKAAVQFEAGKVLAGEGMLEIAFSKSGGLAYAGIFGFAKFPDDGTFTKRISTSNALIDQYNKLIEKEKSIDPKKLENWKQYDPVQAAKAIKTGSVDVEYGIRGSIGMQMDFVNKSFHATTDVYVSTPGNFLTGSGSGGRAGWGVLHIDPSEWYLHLGRPDDRLGLRLGLGRILNIEANSYFMAGNRIPAMPPPPQEVANLIQEDLSNLSLGRNIEALSTGKGLAFGSQFKAQTGDLTFLIMYANFAAGLGFDIMFKDYVEAQCKGRTGTIGMNGWYAQGQTYTYLQGELGVKVNLWLLKAKFPIIKGGAATLLQGGLPDPTFFKGYLGVNVNVLGLIKGKMRFKLTLGEECEIIIPGNSPVDMPMISDLSPADKESEVSVFTTPQATFSVPIGKSFEGSDNSSVKTYRISLKKFDVEDEKGNKVAGKLIWNANKDAVTFQAKEIMPPATKLTSIVRVGFDEFKSGNWTAVYTSGKEAYEEKRHTFTTGNAPSDIPMQNIVYTYPVVNQRYFFTENARNGYIQLQFGQKYLFEKGFDYKLCFRTGENTSITAPFKYNEAINCIEFETPQLQKETPYNLTIVYTQTEVASSQTVQTEKTALVGGEDGDIQISNRKAVAGVSENSEKSILNYTFATSKHGTFRNKMQALNTEGRAYIQDAGISIRLATNVEADEAFDLAEVVGVDKTAQKPLITVRALLVEEFFTKTIIPQVYGGYPYGGLKLTHREEAPIGVPPHNAVFLNQKYISALSAGIPGNKFVFPYAYEASVIAGLDYQNLQTIVLNNRSKVSNEVYRRFASVGSLPFLKKGLYKVVLIYKSPNGTEIAREEFLFTNFLNLNN